MRRGRSVSCTCRCTQAGQPGTTTLRARNRQIYPAGQQHYRQWALGYPKIIETIDLPILPILPKVSIIAWWYQQENYL